MRPDSQPSRALCATPTPIASTMAPAENSLLSSTVAGSVTSMTCLLMRQNLRRGSFS
jgi:hypothetical protein